MPPREGKSELSMIRFPAWYLGRNPDKRVIGASYAASLAMSFSRKVRNLFDDYRFKYCFDAKLAFGSKSVEAWDIEGCKGGMIAAGVGGGITGHGADLFIIDDPVKDREEAESKTYRDKTWNWYTDVARTRLEPEAAIILIMTRWHSDDLAGRLLEEMEKGGDKWETVRLPALAEEKDPIGRKAGEALWPARYSKKTLLETKRAVGSRTWEALYQTRPIKSEGEIVKRDWIVYYDEPPLNPNWFGGIDTATSKKTAADSSSLAELARGDNGYLHVDKISLDKLSVKALADYVLSRQEAKHFTLINLELNNAGEAIKQRIEEIGREKSIYPPIEGVVAKQDKLARLLPVTPLIENGTIKFKRGDPQVEDLIDRLCRFPAVSVDDDIDAFVWAVEAARAGATGEVFEEEIPPERDELDDGEF